MQLKDFIKETLLNITQGVDEANQASQRFQLSNHFNPNKGVNGTTVDFEVGIVVKDLASEGGAAGLNVQLASVFKAGGDLKKGSENTNQKTHNLKFQVFISEKQML